MKGLALFVVGGIASLFLVAAPRVALGGVIPSDGAVPEPTALLVWLGLAGIGGLLYSRRNRRQN